jgi:predicted anti-sigma-YlaC factor YlaD
MKMTDQTQHTTDDQLQAYLDGVLDSPSAKMIQDHLQGCPSCQAQLTRLEVVSSRLKAMPEIDLSRDLAPLVIEQLKEDQSLSPAITWTLVIEALAAGVVISLLIPALQAAGWLPRLINSRQALQAAANLFLTQLASNWLVWWVGFKQQLSLLVKGFNPLDNLLLGSISPWILMAAAGGLMILINALLLGQQSLPKHNQNHFQL